MEDHTTATFSETAAHHATVTDSSDDEIPDGPNPQPYLSERTAERQQPTPEVGLPDPRAAQLDLFTDDEILPVFEADLDLPGLPVAPAVSGTDSACHGGPHD
jgi:hypothetical protein